MSSPEKPFGMTTQAGAEVASPPIVTPDKPRVKEKKQREGKRGITAGRVVLASLATLGTVEAAGIAYQELTNNQPLSPQTIVENAMWPYTAIEDLLKPSIPPSFNPDVQESSIGIGANAIVAQETELQRSYRKQVIENKDNDGPTVGFPVKFTENGQRIDYAFQPPLNNSLIDSKTGKPIIIERPGTINAVYEKGEIIPLTMEDAEVFQFRHAIVNGKDYFQGFFIKFYQNGELYGLRIAQSDVRTFKPLIDISNIPFVPESQGGGLLLSEAKDGAKLPFLTDLILINLNGPKVIFNFNRYNPETKRWESVKPNFVIDESSEQTKLKVSFKNQ